MLNFFFFFPAHLLGLGILQYIYISLELKMVSVKQEEASSVVSIIWMVHTWTQTLTWGNSSNFPVNNKKMREGWAENKEPAV